MNWLDIAIVVVVLGLTFLGWRTGVIRAAAAMVGVIAGVYLAGQFHEAVTDVLDTVITNPNGAKIAAFVLVFLVTLAAAAVAGGLLRRALKLFLLGWADGVVGGALGLVVGVSLMGALTLGLCAFPIGGLGKAVEDSTMAQSFMPVVSGLLPEQIARYVDLDACA